MAIRKDLDDMLNNLTSTKRPEEQKKTVSSPAPKAVNSKIDKMSVEDLLNTLSTDKPAASVKEEVKDEPDTKASEEAEAKRIAERKADEEADAKRLAEQKAAEEAEAKRLAEQKAAEEAEAKRLAEQKAAEEAEAKRLAELKAAEEAEAKRLAELKAASQADEEAESASEEEPEAAPVSEMIKQDAEKSASEPETESSSDPEADEDEQEEEKPAKKSFFGKKSKKKEVEETADEAVEDSEIAEEKSGKLASALEKILDEDPDEIIAKRAENTESDDEMPSKGKFKKGLYAALGVVFAILACIGLVTVIAKGIGMFGSYTSGDTKKETFTKVLYPAVIMDIESFESPSELPSDQIITAAIWSMIMQDGVLDQYEMVFDVVKIPAVDVESYAVKLFGDDLPELTHMTVGPADNRFYFNEESRSYNVPIEPVTFTYAPEIRSATKSGSDYTVTVDYIDERPEWLSKVSSKSVEFRLTETNDGYRIKGMRIISISTNNSL